ncbi:MAG: hypothetical protein R2727_07115 [Bacteroidales bacterium]
MANIIDPFIDIIGNNSDNIPGISNGLVIAWVDYNSEPTTHLH